MTIATTRVFSLQFGTFLGFLRILRQKIIKSQNKQITNNKYLSFFWYPLTRVEGHLDGPQLWPSKTTAISVVRQCSPVCRKLNSKVSYLTYL